MKPEKLFYSFVTRDGYKGNAPKYFEPKDFSWVSNLEANWEIIHKELIQFLESGKELWPYFDQSIVSKQNSWKTIPFGAWGVKFYKNRKNAPKTSALLDGIPGMVSASFNMLDADSTIVPHFGDTNGVMRCHLGLIIPGSLPEIGFEVSGEQKSWEQGKLLLFCDAHEHTAWNHTTEQRFILLFDVIRPEYLDQKRTICSKVLASLLLQSLGSKFKFLHKTPMIMQFGLYQCSILGARLVVPVRNLFGRLFFG